MGDDVLDCQQGVYGFDYTQISSPFAVKRLRAASRHSEGLGHTPWMILLTSSRVASTVCGNEAMSSLTPWNSPEVCCKALLKGARNSFTPSSMRCSESEMFAERILGSIPRHTRQTRRLRQSLQVEYKRTGRSRSAAKLKPSDAMKTSL